MEKIEGEFDVLLEYSGWRWLHKKGKPIGYFIFRDGEMFYKHFSERLMTAQTARFVAGYMEKEMKK